MLLICCDCTTAYAVGALCCPHCGSTQYVEQGSPEHDALLESAARAQAKSRKNIAGASGAAG